MISPTIFFNLVVSVIGALSVFSVAYIGTQGGPAYATYFYVYHLYHQRVPVLPDGVRLCDGLGLPGDRAGVDGGPVHAV